MSGIVLRAYRAATGIQFVSRAAFRAAVERFGLGEDFECVIRPVSKKQGTQSMRYYRGVVVPDIAIASGYDDPDDYPAVHESLAWKFLRMADHPELGYPRRRSTAKGDLTQEEMSAYIDQCITYAEASIPGCRVRRPNEIDDWAHVPDYEFAA